MIFAGMSLLLKSFINVQVFNSFADLFLICVFKIKNWVKSSIFNKSDAWIIKCVNSSLHTMMNTPSIRSIFINIWNLKFRNNYVWEISAESSA